MATPVLDTEADKIGQNQTKEISSTGTAEVISDSGIEQIPQIQMDDAITLDKFMNELVEIFVYEPIDEGHEKVFLVSVNGKQQYIIRGKPQTVKRKYVEVLARSRRVGITASGYMVENGDARNVVNISQGLQYPFQVLHDPNRNGPAWLRRILEAA